MADSRPPTLTTEHFEATGQMLDSLTTISPDGQYSDSKRHLIGPATHESYHSWLHTILGYNTVADFENAWHLGNYVIDRQTGAKSFEAMSIYVRLGMHLLYYGSQQQEVLHWGRAQQLLKEQSVKMGKAYDDPASKSHIVPFIESFQLQDTLVEMVEPDPAKYDTFNHFFAREIKESARPIAEPNNDRVVSSPADCRLTAFPSVDLATKYWIKGFSFSLAKLLGSDALAKQFDGGSIAIARLAPQDYHRWHAPVTGKVADITEIPGTYYTVNPQAINEAGTLDVFCENRRSVMIVDRAVTGSQIAIIAVGAMLVGSIRYQDGVAVGSEIHRGQCLGSFLYGGSTVIVILPKGEVTLDADLVKNSIEEKCETLVKVGWRIGA